MKKMKTPIQLWVLSATLLGLGTQTLMANECCSSPFSGFYLGGAIGGSFSSARENSTTNLSSGFTLIQEIAEVRRTRTIGGSAQHSLQGTQRKNTFAASLYAGFGCAWEDVYLGLEAFLRRTDYRKTHRAIFSAAESTDVPQTTIRLDAGVSNAISLTTRLSPTEPGIDFRPGYFLTPCTMLYGRVGVGYNRLTLHARTLSSALITPPTVIVNPLVGTETASKHKKVGALRLGVGLEQHLGECMSIRVDYINTHYRGIKLRTRGVSDVMWF